MLELDIIDESGSWHRFSFQDLAIDVGRDPDVHLVLPAPNISNEHCRLAAHDGKVVLTDLGSTNGTFVNGVRVNAPVVVRPSDRISIGPYVLLLARNE
ncbi:MAG: FHA domain-containing protein [Deltaproteobacteria bacterium]|nr:FHA domain-containing protein [Deltaproteobacteria bacterium]